MLFRQHSLKLVDKDIKDLRKIVDRMTIWAVSWGLGSFVTSETFGKFEAALNDVFKLDNLPTGSVLDHSLTTNF